MGKKKKIIKGIKSFQKRIEEHKDKIKEYKESGGKNYALIDYWEKETERLKKQKEEEEKRLEE